MENLKVIIDSEGYKSIITNIKANKGFIMVWDDIGGHSEASIHYINECKVIEDKNLVNKYINLYK